MREENTRLLGVLKTKRREFELCSEKAGELHATSEAYEEGRNKGVQAAIEGIVGRHRERIGEKIELHKKDISGIKKMYRDKINAMQNWFEDMVTKEYPALVTKKMLEGKAGENSMLEKNDRKFSLKVE